MNPETISDLKSESAKHKQLATKLDEIIAHLEKEYLSNSNASPQPVVPRFIPIIQNNGILATLAAESDWSKLPQSEVCNLAFLEARRALTREEIIDIANEHNKQITSPDHLSPILSRDPRFEHKGKGVWDLRSRNIGASEIVATGFIGTQERRRRPQEASA